MSLLTIVQNVAGELSLPEPDSVVNNTNTIVKQLLKLANASGRRLFKRHDWQQLKKEYNFTTTAQANQGFTKSIIGPDFDRLVPETMYNRSQDRRVLGPYTPAEWQRDKGTVTSTVIDTFRLWQRNIYFIPDPAAGESIYGEYISNEWVVASDGVTTRTKFENDGDESLIDEDLLVLDVKWRWLNSHGFDYAEAKQEFETEFFERAGRDREARVLTLHTPIIDEIRVNTPEGGFGA